MNRFFRNASLLLAIAVASTPAFAAMKSPEETQAIQQIVHDYLVEHPEVIQEAITALQKKRADEAAETAKLALSENRKQILESPNQMVLGNPNGKVTLVEFFDYNCGYCKRAVSDLTTLIDVNPDLRVVMKEFPILAPGSEEAARISVAVKDIAPDKYLAFHQELFSRPGEANAAKALGVARDLKLDADKLAKAAKAQDVTDNIAEVHALAEKLGISGTPSYVLGDQLVPGAAGYDALQKMVTAVAECGKTTC